MDKKLHYILLIIIISGISNIGNSQDAYYSQYYNTPTFYNPAYTGLNQGMRFRLTYRNQWPKYSDDLKTYHFSTDVAERFMPGAGGIGVIFDANKEGNGFIKRNMIGILGSVRVKLNRNLVSQFGFTGAYVQKQIDGDDLIWSDQLDDRQGLLYPNSSFAGFANESVSYPDFTFGWLGHHQKEYYTATFGLAIHHVFKPNESFFDLDIRVPRKYTVHTDFVIFQKRNPREGFRFNPGILYENQAGFNTFTLGSNFAKSVMYAGAWYRNKQSQIYNYQALIMLVGINIPMVNKYSRMKLTYSYDLSLTNMDGNGGAHEISLRFEFDEIHLIKSRSKFANDYPIIYDPVVF